MRATCQEDSEKIIHFSPSADNRLAVFLFCILPVIYIRLRLHCRIPSSVSILFCDFYFFCRIFRCIRFSLSGRKNTPGQFFISVFRLRVSYHGEPFFLFLLQSYDIVSRSIRSVIPSSSILGQIRPMPSPQRFPTDIPSLSDPSPDG